MNTFLKTSIILVFVITLCAHDTSWSLQTYQDQIDSLESVLTKDIPDTTYLNTLLKLSQAYRTSEPDKANQLAQKLSEKATELSNEKYKVEGLFASASALARLTKYDSAIEVGSKAYFMTIELGDSLMIMYGASKLGYYYSLTRNYKRAVHFKQIGYDIAKALDSDVNLLINAGTNVANLRQQLGQEREEEQVIKEMIKYLESPNVKGEIRARVNYYFMRRAYTNGDRAKAVDYAKRVLRQIDKISPRLQINYLVNIGVIVRGTNDFGYSSQIYHLALRRSLDNKINAYLNNIYHGLGYNHLDLRDYDSALYYHNKRLDLAKSSGQNISIADAYCSTAEFYSKIGRIDFAQRDYRTIKSLLTENGQINYAVIPDGNELRALNLLYSADSALGNYEESLKYFKLITRKKDSLNKMAQDEKFQRLELEYQTQAKNKEIELLKSQAEIQSVKSEQQSRINLALIIVGVLLLLVVVLLYARYLLKRESVRTITAQKQSLEQKNEENTRLMQEIHHRVKNNLQIMLSLLNTQADLVNDNQAKAIVTESQNRIRSMALIHQSLYQSGKLVIVNAQQYIEELVQHIKESFYEKSASIKLVTNIDSLQLRMSHAVPIGLILNELITNSIKYAFKDKTGTIYINFKEDTKDTFHLQVIDDGIGFSDDFSFKESQSFGLKLVRGLTEQLSGRLTMITDSGTRFDIYLPVAASEEVQEKEMADAVGT